MNSSILQIFTLQILCSLQVQSKTIFEKLKVVWELHLLSFNKVAIIKMENHIPFVIKRYKDFIAGNTQDPGTRKFC